MAKPRRQRDKEETSSSVKAMVDALKFCAIASHGIGQPYTTHVRISNSRAIAFDGTLAAGTFIQADSDACPHLDQLIAALSKCDDQVSITQLDNVRMAIKSGPLKATVKCMNPLEIPPVWPDVKIIDCDERVTKALVTAAALVVASGAEVVTSAVLLDSIYAYGTNRNVMYRYEHGVTLPGPAAVPRAAIDALAKARKELVGLGGSPTSLTFWFADGSWLRTQLYAEGWPVETARKLFEAKFATAPFPPKFFEALEAVKPFCEMKRCYFVSGGISSHQDSLDGARYEVTELPEKRAYNIEYLLAIEDIADKVDFFSDNEKVYFEGENLTGILMAMK